VARLIALDASVAIAALAADDPHDDAAVDALAGARDDELALAATTRAEILRGFRPCSPAFADKKYRGDRSQLAC
jgi:predicted nucleic acid-binding protein